MAGRLYTDPKKFAAALLRFAEREKDRPIVNGIRRGMHIARNIAAEEFKKQGVGRGIFVTSPKKDKKSIRLIIKRERVRKVGERFEAGLLLRGFAALQEKGGQTKSHEIKPSTAKRLVFPLGGRVIVTKRVRHPGSRIPAHPFVRRSIELALARMREEVLRGLQATAEKVLG